MAKESVNGKKLYGYSDTQMKKLNKSQAKLVAEIGDVLDYRLIAEVVKSENCISGHKVGDKFVMNGAGQLLPKECTNKDTLCIFALAKLNQAAAIYFDRIMSGNDPLSGSIFEVLRCEDVGMENGGWGEIVMKLYVRKK